MNAQLGVILTAMVTPFDESDELDLREAQRLARWLVERGNDGLVIAGSTGEGQTLDARERAALWGAVKEAVGNEAVVVANAGTNSTRESISAVADAQAAGADAILAVVPYYNKPTQSGMLAHFGAIAEATTLPVVIYNIPGRTGGEYASGNALRTRRPPFKYCRRQRIERRSQADWNGSSRSTERFYRLGRRRSPLSTFARAGCRRRRRRRVAPLFARVSRGCSMPIAMAALRKRRRFTVPSCR